MKWRNIFAMIYNDCEKFCKNMLHNSFYEGMAAS